MIITVDMWTIFYAWFIIRYMNCLHTKFITYILLWQKYCTTISKRIFQKYLRSLLYVFLISNSVLRVATSKALGKANESTDWRVYNKSFLQFLWVTSASKRVKSFIKCCHQLSFQMYLERHVRQYIVVLMLFVWKRMEC